MGRQTHRPRRNENHDSNALLTHKPKSPTYLTISPPPSRVRSTMASTSCCVIIPPLMRSGKGTPPTAERQEGRRAWEGWVDNTAPRLDGETAAPLQEKSKELAGSLLVCPSVCPLNSPQCG